MSPDDPQRNDRKELFRRRISEIESRRIRERHREYKQLWFGLGTMGIIGWSVSIPTLAFLALGIWIDSKTGGSISWTLTGMITGVVVGSVTAWFWVRYERDDGED